MGILKRQGGAGDTFPLDRAELLVGRGQACDLVLADPEVSSRHATLTWTREGWCVRDLGSRNGTDLGPQGSELKRLSNAPARLRVGDVLRFGAVQQVWAVRSDARPTARALQVETGALVHEASDLSGLLLHGPTGATRVYPDGDLWMHDDATSVAPVSDLQEIVSAGCRWRLLLPLPLDLTVPSRDPGAPQRTVQIRLSRTADTTLLLESRDEDRLSGALVQGARRIELPRRKYLRLLWLLAQNPGSYMEQRQVLERLEIPSEKRYLLDNYVHQIRIILNTCGEVPQSVADRLIERQGGRIRLVPGYPPEP